MTKWKYKHIDGYSGNLSGNYFTDGQITDYEPIVKKFPEWFEIFEEDKIENKDGIKLTIEQEEYLNPEEITFKISEISIHQPNEELSAQKAIDCVKDIFEEDKIENKYVCTSDPEAFEEYNQQLLKETSEENDYDGTPEITDLTFNKIETIEWSKNDLDNIIDEDIQETTNEEFVEPKSFESTMPIIVSEEIVVKEKSVKSKKDDKKKTKTKK